MNTQLKKTLSTLPILAQKFIAQVEKKFRTYISIERPDWYTLAFIEPDSDTLEFFQGDKIFTRKIKLTTKLYIGQAEYTIPGKVIDFLKESIPVHLHDEIEYIIHAHTDTHYPVINSGDDEPRAWITVFRCKPGLKRALQNYHAEEAKRERYFKAKRKTEKLFAELQGDKKHPLKPHYSPDKSYQGY